MAVWLPAAWCLSQTPEQQRLVDEAVASYRLAVTLRPTDAAAYYELSSAYQEHKFLRAASVELAHAVALRPDDPEWLRRLGVLTARTGDLPAATRHFHASLTLRPSSSETYLNLGHALGAFGGDLEGQKAAFEHAISLSPTQVAAYLGLAHVLERQQRGGALTLLRQLMRFNAEVGGRRLVNALTALDRHLEAAVTYVDALRLQRAEAVRDGRSVANLSLAEDEVRAWHEFVRQAERDADSHASKCIGRVECIAGLERALRVSKERPSCAEVNGETLKAGEVTALMASATPEPTVLRHAVATWPPFIQWEEAFLAGHAGNDPVDVTVVTERDSFEVQKDQMIRPPKSKMRLRDLVVLLGLKRDFNLTLYTRQASLWSMPRLLRALAPLDWMSTLHVRSLNIWLGDGLFKNTMHNDPYDNFLCQIRGVKHVMLFPPSVGKWLGYFPRRDIQASYSVSRGEYGRRDTGIVSDNTASVNMASDEVLGDPLYSKAELQMRYARLAPSDCLYLPQGWHHHVFSEADEKAGFNLAVNMWIYRDGEHPNAGWSLEMIHRELSHALDGVESGANSPDSSDAENAADSLQATRSLRDEL